MDSVDLESRLASRLASRKDRRILRHLPIADDSDLIDFNSNDYLGFGEVPDPLFAIDWLQLPRSSSPTLRNLFLEKLRKTPRILGSGGSRLLVNPETHESLEARLKSFFNVESALLFNSGFDANVGFFSCVPDQGDFVVYDEYIHASVHDGINASRVHQTDRFAFKHNCMVSFVQVLSSIRDSGRFSNVFIAVESLYSMDGTFSPLTEIVQAMNQFFPENNAYLVVDEAHAVGIYGPDGRGRVSELGLDDKVLARLCTFGKALAASGAVLLTTRLVRDYLLNYARSLIYTTTLSCASVIAVDCSFDLLEDGTAAKLSQELLSLSQHFVRLLANSLDSGEISTSVLSLPLRHGRSAIVPVHTPYAHALSAYLLKHKILCKPITYPTVPKGKDRVRVCLHANNQQEEVEHLFKRMREWARFQQGSLHPRL